MLKARNKKMPMAALIPGLPIQVEGMYDAQNRLVAKTIRCKGNDFEPAQAIQAGLAETSAQAKQNSAELEKQNAASDPQARVTKITTDIWKGSDIVTKQIVLSAYALDHSYIKKRPDYTFFEMKSAS